MVIRRRKQLRKLVLRIKGTGESDIQESALELIHSSECIVSGRNGLRSRDLDSGLPHEIHLAPAPYLDPVYPLLRHLVGVGGCTKASPGHHTKQGRNGARRPEKSRCDEVWLL